MNIHPQVLKEFIERIRLETKWAWIQYLRVSLASFDVIECSDNPTDAAAAEALCQLIGLCHQSPKGGEINANSIYRKGPLLNRHWTEFTESDMKIGIPPRWPYLSLYPVKYDTVYYGSLLIHHAEPLSEHSEQLLSTYAHEAAALERVSDLEQRVQDQEWKLHDAIIELAHAHDAAAEAVADHLHGKVQSYLLVASHQLQQCQDLLKSQPSQITDILQSTMDLLDTVRDQHIRQLSHQLHPAFIRLGLTPALEHLIRRYHSVLNLKLRIDATVRRWDQLIESPLPPATRLATYRIVEEALNNVIQHAHANSVEVRVLVEDGQWLIVHIEDNGNGRQSHSFKEHLGTLTMRARAEELGGTLKWTPVSPQGTRITCTLPIAISTGLLKTI